jgi:hypothetical protein
MKKKALHGAPFFVFIRGVNESRMPACAEEAAK